MKPLRDRATVEILCPKCDAPPKLIIRTNRANDSKFLGCPNFPECRHTQPIPQDMLMEAAGAQRLPGF